MPDIAVAIEFFAFIALAVWLLVHQVRGARRPPDADAQAPAPADPSGNDPGSPKAG